MIISLVAAMARNRVIGREGRLPWNLPADLKNFRRLTLGRPVLMGRRTFESLGRPLPGRDNLVLSRDPGFQSAGVRVVRSLEEALELAQGSEELMVIGGANLYAQALERARRLYLTLIHEDFPGDALFPGLDPAAWKPVGHERHPLSLPESPYPWSFLILDRVEDTAMPVDVPAGLPEEARARFLELLEEPATSPERLLQEIDDCLGMIRRIVMEGAPLDVSFIEEVAAEARRLVRGLGPRSSQQERRLVQAAVRYFVLADDAEGDLVSVIGFDDDARVLQAVAEHLGR